MFVVHDADGAVLATVQAKAAPITGLWIEVPTAELGDLTQWRVQGGELVWVSITPVRLAAIEAVNRCIGEIRARYITAIPGQEMIYLKKEEEARRYIAQEPEPSSLSDYPMIAAEIGITAPTAWQIAQIWMQMSALLSSTAAGLEGLRLGTIAALDAATTPDSISAILAGFQTSLEAAFSPS
ncbi:hypothetical protein [Tabrizicola fusiformis]|uniref:hypothetical protein n=1 Tax=Tabrizicola sp. SY72 TaxID=2741673 RepID=UPI001573C66D|nr:hypothetical protein [Tabrizicola sp. SY72]NTT87832.1 hypothetical protein [Tabrizicola sp. SY72]